MAAETAISLGRRDHYSHCLLQCDRSLPAMPRCYIEPSLALVVAQTMLQETLAGEPRKEREPLIVRPHDPIDRNLRLIRSQGDRHCITGLALPELKAGRPRIRRFQRHTLRKIIQSPALRSGMQRLSVVRARLPGILLRMAPAACRRANISVLRTGSARMGDRQRDDTCARPPSAPPCIKDWVYGDVGGQVSALPRKGPAASSSREPEPDRPRESLESGPW